MAYVYVHIRRSSRNIIAIVNTVRTRHVWQVRWKCKRLLINFRQVEANWCEFTDRRSSFVSVNRLIIFLMSMYRNLNGIPAVYWCTLVSERVMPKSVLRNRCRSNLPTHYPWSSRNLYYSFSLLLLHHCTSSTRLNRIPMSEISMNRDYSNHIMLYRGLFVCELTGYRKRAMMVL